jgi:hypothetical protein
MASLLPGAIINNRYRIIRLLGQGGMGAVYLAEDGNLPGRHVAVKENFDPSQSAQDQFKREALILARLKHPNLPQVTDHFVERPSGRQYLIMDYVEGEDLDTLLARRGPLPEAEVLNWIGQVLDAVEYMHAWVDSTSGQPMPVIHRDIKPANIKLTPQGRIMLVDFGIAKYQTGGGTQTGARAASDGFSPVEQYTGGTDARSDIYAIGATLYCLLTGEVPRKSPEIAAGKPLLPPRSYYPAISAHTERAILRAMQTQAASRYASVRDLRQALLATTVTQTPKLKCAACGTPNRATARFCQSCGAALLVTRPFALKPVATWSGAGALLGLLLAHVPKLAVSVDGLVANQMIFAGALFLCALGAAGGAVIARKTSLDAPDFLPKFGLTLLLSLLGSGGLGLLVGNLALGGGFEFGPTVLAFLGSVGGGIGGVRFTETDTFSKIKWA